MIVMKINNLKFILSEKSLLHYQPFPKPNLESFDSALRVQMAEKHLRRKGMITEETLIQARKAREEDILLVHSPYLLDSVKLMSELGSGEVGDAAYASPDLMRSAIYTVGGALQAVESVVKGKEINTFTLMRPPGHHASTSNPMGLCYFNNIAIAVEFARRHLGVEKVSIIDFDDHFGNGTAEIFYSNPNVQYISLHEYDYENFGQGHYEEIGHGEGEGTNINIPLVDGAPDESYKAAIDEIVIPSVKSFDPEVIAISAGYDAHYADPVGNMAVDTTTFWYIGKTVRSLVESTKAKGSFWILEGGYNPLMIGPSIEASMDGLLGKPLQVMEDQIERVTPEPIIDANHEAIARVFETVNTYW